MFLYEPLCIQWVTKNMMSNYAPTSTIFIYHCTATAGFLEVKNPYISGRKTDVVIPRPIIIFDNKKVKETWFLTITTLKSEKTLNLECLHIFLYLKWIEIMPVLWEFLRKATSKSVEVQTIKKLSKYTCFGLISALKLLEGRAEIL